MKFKKSGFVVDGTVEVIDRLPPGNAHPVRKVLRTMEVDQTLFVAREDWTRTGKTPLTMMNEVSREQKKEFEFWVATDDSGWYIIRVA
ncbi:MAG: hypothetical protein GC178_10200 [Flavobacteriales bacterium]|nr:hypothetical protein [Flavobacteriales bacterium]